MRHPTILVGILRRVIQLWIITGNLLTFHFLRIVPMAFQVLKDLHSSFGHIHYTTNNTSNEIKSFRHILVHENSFRRWITIQKPNVKLMRSANREFARNFFILSSSLNASLSLYSLGTAEILPKEHISTKITSLLYYIWFSLLVRVFCLVELREKRIDLDCVNAKLKFIRNGFRGEH